MQALEPYQPAAGWNHWYACLQGKHGIALRKKAYKWGKRLALRLLISRMCNLAAQIEHVLYCSNRLN